VTIEDVEYRSWSSEISPREKQQRRERRRERKKEERGGEKRKQVEK